MTEHEVYCAFLDVLGFSRILDDWQKAVEYYERVVMKVMPAGYRFLEEVYRSVGPPNGSSEVEVHYRIVSDSMILTSMKLERLLEAVAEVNYLCCMQGYWIRGGIARGAHLEHHSDRGDLLVVSRALRDAHDIEAKVADFPRIVVDQRVVDDLARSSPSGIEKELAFSHGRYLIQCEDSRWIVTPAWMRPAGAVGQAAETVDAAIAATDDPKHRRKHIWYAHLHNFLAAQGHVQAHLADYYCDKVAYQHNLRELVEHNELARRELVTTVLADETYPAFYKPSFRQAVFGEDHHATAQRLQRAVRSFNKAFDVNVGETLSDSPGDCDIAGVDA